MSEEKRKQKVSCERGKMKKIKNETKE